MKKSRVKIVVFVVGISIGLVSTVFVAGWSTASAVLDRFVAEPNGDFSALEETLLVEHVRGNFFFANPFVSLEHNEREDILNSMFIRSAQTSYVPSDQLIRAFRNRGWGEEVVNKIIEVVNDSQVEEGDIASVYNQIINEIGRPRPTAFNLRELFSDSRTDERLVIMIILECSKNEMISSRNAFMILLTGPLRETVAKKVLLRAIHQHEIWDTFFRDSNFSSDQISDFLKIARL